MHRKQRIIQKNLKIKFLTFILLLLGSSRTRAKSRASGGKSAVKSALPGLGKLQNNKLGSDTSNSKSADIANDGKSATESAYYALKQTLMTGYDKAMRPVINITDVLEVEVDVIYRQVLDMDEKNQLLTSLVWYRQHWQDIYLKWNPESFQGLEELWLPAEYVWRPDIVLQEETGGKDYSPRLPFVKVNFNGHVEYHEPTSFTTTCSMNTMHFPFDVQHCTLTFSSWTHPGSKILLKPERLTKQMANDLKIFINTGEWKLEHVEVKNQVANYSSIMVESAADYIDWPEVAFTITLRRNSSFYMQSMMFPSILLTSIALLGFFLPPDSGERVGLQITILLTFMVFLLTVCEMFPASTGPYLGMYYVICIFLLAVNLLMTVLVLQLYYHPCKPVPAWIKSYLKKIGRCCFIDVTQLDDFGDFTDDKRHDKEKYESKSPKRPKKAQIKKSCLCNVMLSCLREVHEDTAPCSDNRMDDDNTRHRCKRRKSSMYSNSTSPPYERSGGIHRKRRGRQQPRCDTCERDASPGSLSDGSLFRHAFTPSPKLHRCRKRSFYVRKDFVSDNGSRAEARSIYYMPQCNCAGNTPHIRKRTKDFENHAKFLRKSIKKIDEIPAVVDDKKEAGERHLAAENMLGVCAKITDVLTSMKEVVNDVRVKNMENEIENEWKKVALIMDKFFLRLYSALLVISHVSIVGMAIFTSYTIEPHEQHLKATTYMRQPGASPGDEGMETGDHH